MHRLRVVSTNPEGGNMSPIEKSKVKGSDQARQELINQLLSMIHSSFAFRNNDELRAMLDSFGSPKHGAANLVLAPNRAAFVHIYPDATKTDTIKALEQITSWIDEHWDEFQLERKAQLLKASGSSKIAKDLPN